MEPIKLIPIEIRHAKPIQKNFDDPLVQRFLSKGIPRPYELGHAVSFCESAMTDEYNGMGMHRVIMSGDVFVGYIGMTFRLDARLGVAELGYWLASRYFGQGIMPQAIRMATDEALGMYPFLRRIQCSIPAANTASLKAAQKAGYTHEATLEGGFLLGETPMDEHIYAYLR